MALRTVSVDSGTPQQIHARRAEMEHHWPAFADPCAYLIQLEERAQFTFAYYTAPEPAAYVSDFINRRIGDQHVRIQRSKRNAGSATRHRRNRCKRNSPHDRSSRVTIGDAVGTSWNDRSRVVGLDEVLLEKEQHRWVPSRTAG